MKPDRVMQLWPGPVVTFVKSDYPSPLSSIQTRPSVIDKTNHIVSVNQLPFQSLPLGHRPFVCM